MSLPAPVAQVPVTLVPEIVDGPAPPAEVSVPPAQRPRRRTPSVMVGWLVTVLILVEFAYIVQAYPGPIIRTWPAAQRAYALFGVQTAP